MVDYDMIPFRNSQIENQKKAYDAQEKKENGIDIGESSMFTGNAWFDIGLALGRARTKKLKSNSKK